MTVVNYDWDEDEDNIVEEYDDTGTTVAAYTTEPDLFGNVLSQRRNGQDRVYHYDGQGSTLALTDSSGNITDTYAYSAFGEVIRQSGSTVNTFQYIGQKGYYIDPETGGCEVRRRIIAINQGRWISVDPVQVDIYYHPYSYVRNQPLISIDPEGLKCIVCKWGGPFFTGKTSDYDKDLDSAIHRQGILARQKVVASSLAPAPPVGWGYLPVATEDYGPYIIDLTVKDWDFDQLFVGGCHAVRVYVCGDDCVVSINEERTNYEWNDKAKEWKKERRPTSIKEADKITPPSKGGSILIAGLKGTKAGDCDKVIVITDCPLKASHPRSKNYYAWDIKQTISVIDSVTDKTADFSYTFRIGLKMPIEKGKYESEYHEIGKSKSDVMGDAADCKSCP